MLVWVVSGGRYAKLQQAPQLESNDRDLGGREAEVKGVRVVATGRVVVGGTGVGEVVDEGEGDVVIGRRG